MNDRLKIAIKSKSMNELEKKTGIKRQTLHRIYTGKETNPKLETCLSICKALGYSLEYLFGDYENSMEYLEITPTIKAMIKKERILKGLQK